MLPEKLRREDSARFRCIGGLHIARMQRPETIQTILLLDYQSAAKALSLSPAALRDLVYKGRGPVATRIGRRTFFALADLEAFVEAHREPSVTAMPTEKNSAKRKRGRPTVSSLMKAI